MSVHFCFKSKLFLSIFIVFFFCRAKAETSQNTTLQLSYALQNCLDIKGNSTAPGTTLQSYPCNTSRAQRFVITHRDDGYFSIATLNGTNLCLDSGNGAIGTVVVQQKCNTNSNQQKFRIALNTKNNTYSVLTMNGSAAFLVTGANTAPSTIALAKPQAVPYQQFLLNPDVAYNFGFRPVYPIIATQSTVFKLSDNQSFCLDIRLGSNLPGTNLQSYSCNSSGAQKFVVQKTGVDGHFYIRTLNGANLCLDAGNNALGTKVVQRPCDSKSLSQKWRIALNADNTVTILNMNAKLALTVNGPNNKLSTDLVMGSTQRIPANQFVFGAGNGGLATLGYKPAPYLAGVCGPSNGVSVSMPPSDNLCAKGSVAGFSGSGPWKWQCTGSGGGGVASCSAPLAVAGVKSVKSFVTCDGNTDDSIRLAQAFTAARNNAFKLQIDCPVRLRIGSNGAHTIFIDNGTTVIFSGAGKLIVDNVGVPAFVIANTNNVSLENWIVQYEGTYGVDKASAPGIFNDTVMKAWMIKNRGINYVNGATPLWPGPPNLSAIFTIKGSSSSIDVTNMKVFVPANAGGQSFIPMVFSFIRGERSNKIISRDLPIDATNFAIPSTLNFENLDFDGTYFGFQGNLRNATFKNIRSHRYGDLQDANGGNVGGVGKWFAPPHLFYINYNPSGDPALFNRDLHVSNVIDYGNRVGIARDRAGDKSLSGYANSFKFGGFDSSIDNYTSYRPDGFMDVLDATNMTISNVTATYNSAFLNNFFPGIRFPAANYHNVTFSNITISDLAPTSIVPPIMGNNQPTNSNITFTNTVLNVKSWKGKEISPEYSPTVPGTRAYFGGTGHNINYIVNIGK